MEPTSTPFSAPARGHATPRTLGLSDSKNKKDVHHPAPAAGPLHGIFVEVRGKGQIEFFVLLFRLGHSCSNVYASTVTRPLGLVTLTPSALALAMMSTRLREETAEAILFITVSIVRIALL